jgi:hypothetical protein
LVNLAAAEGHPASVMDMSFANQAMRTHAHELANEVYSVPEVPGSGDRAHEAERDGRGDRRADPRTRKRIWHRGLRELRECVTSHA